MAKHITFEQWKKQNPERLNNWRTCVNCHGSGDDELTCRACEYCNGEGSINMAREYYDLELRYDDMKLKAWMDRAHLVYVLPHHKVGTYLSYIGGSDGQVHSKVR